MFLSHKKIPQVQDQAAGDATKYKFMTSVSMPVFDRRESAVSETLSDNSFNGFMFLN